MIGGYFTSKQNKKASTEERIKTRDEIKIFLFDAAIEGESIVHSFPIDMTGM